MTGRAERPRFYRGCLVTREAPNSAGMRWGAFVPDAAPGRPGRVRAETLEGVRAMIRHAQGVDR